MKTPFARRASTPSNPVDRSAPSRPPVPPLIRRNTLYIALTQAMGGIGAQLFVTFSALMVVRLTGAVGLAGLGGSIVGLSRFLIAYPTGKLTDAYGRRAGMMFGLVTGLAGGLLLGLSITLSSFPVFLAGMVVLGLGVGATMQLRVAASDMYPPARRGEGLGYVLTGSVAGAVVGPVVVGVAELIARRIGADAMATVWYLTPVALVPAMVLVLLVRPDPKAIGANLQSYWPGYEQPAAPAQPGVKTSLRSLLQHPPKQVAYVSYTAAQSTMAMMMVMTPLVMRDSGHAFPAISLAVSLHVVGMFGFSIPLGRLTDRIGRRPMLWGGLIIQAVGAVLVPVTPLYWVITFGLFLVGIGWSAVNVASTAVLADTTSPEERGRAVGANDTLAGALGVLTPLAGGVVADLAGLLAVGVLGAGLSVAPLLLMGRLREVRPGFYQEGAPQAAAP